MAKQPTDLAGACAAVLLLEDPQSVFGGELATPKSSAGTICQGALSKTANGPSALSGVTGNTRRRSSSKAPNGGRGRSKQRAGKAPCSPASKGLQSLRSLSHSLNRDGRGGRTGSPASPATWLTSSTTEATTAPSPGRWPRRAPLLMARLTPVSIANTKPGANSPPSSLPTLKSSAGTIWERASSGTANGAPAPDCGG